MAKVSVIVPVYNGAETIKDCVDSILGQTLEGMEVIVVNDGSDDATADILQAYGNRIIVLNQNRQGQGNARNAGIEAASGEYLGFVDADDTIEPEMYAVMYTAAKRHGAQMVQCGIRDIQEDGTETERTRFGEDVCITDRAEYVFDYFYRLKHTNEVCNKLIQKQFLQEHDLRFSDTGVYFSEDFKLNMEMILYLDRISFVDRSFYKYFIKDSGHCRNDVIGRIPKILKLFENVLSREMEDGTRKGLECVAALTVLLYCRQAMAASRTYAAEFLQDRNVRKYLRTSMVYRSNLKHFLLYFSILYLPKSVKLFLLNKFLKF